MKAGTIVTAVPLTEGGEEVHTLVTVSGFRPSAKESHMGNVRGDARERKDERRKKKV